VPGGVTFENIALLEQYRAGQILIFGFIADQEP